MKQAVLLVDGDMFLHRCLHIKSLHNFQNAEGEKTGIVYGTMNSVFKLLNTFNDYEVTDVYFLLSTGKSFRVNIDENYKFKSEKDQQTWTEVIPELGTSMGEYYQKQKDLVKSILPVFGVKVFWKHSYEADDLAAFLCQLDFQGKRKILVSDDYDWCHLVSKDTDVFRHTKEEYITLDNFEEVLGFKSPEFHCLYLSIIGGHDNIPGVLKGFGEVSAKKMIQALPDASINSIKEWAEKQTGKGRMFLEEEVISRLEKNIKLVNLLAVEFDQEFRRELKMKLRDQLTYDYQNIKNIISKYQFNSFLKYIENGDLFPLYN